MIEGEFYNDSENIFIFESDLRKRINPTAMWPDVSTPDVVEYANAGFYPVEYADLQEFQTHDKSATYIENGKAVVPAVDIDIPIAKGKAAMEMDDLRMSAIKKPLPITINGVKKYFSMSDFSREMVSNKKFLKNSDNVEWLLADGTSMLLTDDDLENVYNGMQVRIKTAFAKQVAFQKNIISATTVSAVRELINNARSNIQ